nr:hypothetical protein P5630_01710 [Bacillus subtilis]
MTKQEKATIYRDVNKHSELGLESPVGEVNEEELKNLAGAKNVNQEEPLSSFIPEISVLVSQRLFAQLPGCATFIN